MKHQIIIAAIILSSVVHIQSQILYKISDFFKNPIEYRTPFTMSLFDLKAGTQIIGFTGNSILFDSTETELEKFNLLPVRSMNSFEIDLIKYNYLRYILPQNFIDFSTGLGLKYTSAMINLGLPGTWEQEDPKDKTKLYFSPRLIEANINQSFLFQWSPRFYNYFQINFGMAYASAYRSRGGNRYLDQEGWTYSFALGIKMFRKIGTVSKEGYGIEIKYTSARFDELRDPYKLSPITNLDFSSIGIYFTINSIIGGDPTLGDEAKTLYNSGDYIASKANFEEFIQSYPKHPKKFKANRMIQNCINRIPYQEVALAESFLETQNFAKASQYLTSASKTTDSSLVSRIKKNYNLIAKWYIEEIDTNILANDIDKAEILLKEVETLKISEIRNLLDQYWSEIYFHRGVAFTEYEIWDKAIYFFDRSVRKYPQIRERVDPWLLKIAFGYINDVNKSVDQKNIDLALESLRQATRIRPDIGFITKEHIEKLEEGIEYLKQEAASQKLKKSVEKSFTPPTILPQPEIGMKSETILSLLGKPTYKNQLEDSIGQIFELWIYQYPDGIEKHLYFRGKKLLKIETR